MAVPRFGRPNGRTRRPREGRIFQRKAVDEKKRSEREKEEESSRLFRLGNQIKSRDNGNRFLRKKVHVDVRASTSSLDFFYGSRAQTRTREYPEDYHIAVFDGGLISNFLLTRRDR